MTARFVLNELDLDLSTFSAALLIIIVIVITCHGSPIAFGAAGIHAVAGQVIARGGVVEASVGVGNVSHDEYW